MKLLKYVKGLFLGFGILFFIQCNQKCKQDCSAGFFEKRSKNDTSEVSLTFKLSDPTISNGKCKLKHEFVFWRGGAIGDKPWPYLHLNGSIYSLGDAIYFEIDSGNTFKYFDFNMVVNQREPTTFFKYTYSNDSKKNFKLQWQYDLVLETKFLDTKIQDTVYKFRFSNIGLQMEGTDMVLYVSKDYGLIGGYHAGLLGDTTEEMFSSVGNIFNETDKKYIRRSTEGRDIL